MPSPGTFNPQAIENHYGMEMACYQASRLRPATVRICTPDPSVATAVVRRLAGSGPALFVEDERVAEDVRAQLGVSLEPIDDRLPDVAVVPFARAHYPQPPPARALVLLGHNACSYKGLLNPGAVTDTLPAQLSWMRAAYTVGPCAGLYGPRFVLLWALSLALAPRSSAAHFWLGQRALDSIYTTGVFWWTGYITILCGRQR